MALSDPALAIESPLQPSELGDANALVQEASWNQIAADWRIFLELGRVYAVRNSEGRVVATAATLPYGGRFAWISMVLVSTSYRRQGLATRLLRRCIADLTASGLVPVLDATPDGREVYHALGFEDAWGYHRLVLRNPATLPPIARAENIDVRPIDDDVWAAICDYDASAFGTERSDMLARLRGRLPRAELYATQQGRITGVLLGRDGRAAMQFGPLLAEDDATALALLQRALGDIRAPIYIDLADAKNTVRHWLEAAGFSAVRPLTRMLLHRSKSFDDPQRTFAVVGPEFG